MIIKKDVFHDHEICEFDSSNIEKSIYTPSMEELIITFRKGGSYSYKPITSDLYTKFCLADSQGKFFLDKIKKNKDILFEKIG